MEGSSYLKAQVHGKMRARTPRLSALGTAAAMAALLGMAMTPAPARAQASLNVVMSQTTLLAGYPSGGAFGSGTPAGTSMAVNSLGTLIVSTSYGSQIAEFDATTGASTVLGNYNNPGPVAVDSANNLYIADLYDTTIVKIPFVSGAYAAIASPGSSTPVCTGADTVECTLPAFTSGPYGWSAMTFDAGGDLFITSRDGGSAGDAIFECTAACLKAASPAATKIYQEPLTSTSQIILGGIATDPYGDVFFTDSIVDSNEDSSSSNLNELTASGSGFSASKTVLYTLTIASPGQYDNQLTSVAVDNSGIVYFATEFDGIFAFPNNHGTVTTSKVYSVSTQGAKIMTTDGKGNFYVTSYSNATGGDAATRVSVGAIQLPTTGVGVQASATNVSTILNNGSCGASPSVTFAATESGAATTEFSAATTGSCSSVNITGAPLFATTVNFTPTAAGTRSATLTATDNSSFTGTASVTGVGTNPPAATPTFSPAAGSYTTVQSVTISDTTSGAAIYYTTDGSTPTTTSTLYSGAISVGTTETIKAIAVESGYANSTVGSAAYTITLPAATPVFTPVAGSYTSIQSVAITDSTPNVAIYYTTNGTAPTSSSTLYSAPISVSATQTIQAIAIAPGYSNSAVASAAYSINLGPPFTLAINPSTLTLSSTGGQALANVTLTPRNGFKGTVSFACSGLPAGATCSFSPTTVTPNLTYTVTTVLTVSTTGISALHRPDPFAPTATFALVVCLFGFRKRRGVKLMLVLAMGIFAATLVSGCSSSSTATHTPSTSVVTVTGTSGTTTETATVSVTLQ